MTIQLPIPGEVLGDCGAILGTRGAGKSGTGRGMAEHELDAGHRICCIDPKGDWYGIRANKDGTPSRFDVVVFGGEHADIEITDDMGKVLGEIIAKGARSSVIDLSGFSRAGMLRFMAAFAEALFFHNRQPITLFVDEADQLAPQRVPAEVARLLHHMEALIRQGRQRGILMWMLTQRPAVLNKNLLSQAATLIAMKMTAPQDRKAIRDWMDSHDSEKAAAIERSLPKLKVGQGYVWCPEAEFLEQVQFPMYESYDSGRTPRHGEVVGDVKLRPLDVAALREALTGSPEESDELAEAHRQIAQLTEQNATLRRRVQTAESQRNATAEALVMVQDLIGMTIGSPAIEALPPGAARADYLMVLDGDGVVRPTNAGMVMHERIRGGVRQMRNAALPKVPETPVDAAIAALNWSNTPPVVAALENAPPALRRIVFAIGSGGGSPIAADRIAAAAGVTLTSSNMGIGLRRIAETGIIAQQGDAWRAVIA
jgi:hypothetical protein